MVLEAGNLKSRCLQGWFLLGAMSGTLFLPLVLASDGLRHLWELMVRCIQSWCLSGCWAWNLNRQRLTVGKKCCIGNRKRPRANGISWRKTETHKNGLDTASVCCHLKPWWNRWSTGELQDCTATWPVRGKAEGWDWAVAEVCWATAERCIGTLLSCCDWSHIWTSEHKKWLFFHFCLSNIVQTSLVGNPNLETFREESQGNIVIG